MATVTVDPECPRLVRRVRRLIRNHMGDEAATVFSEAMANVREHNEAAPAELVLHDRRFEVKNASQVSFQPESDKPEGEGGYGLPIMQRMGASLDATERYCCVRWRRPEA